jgi:hypothetical protein
MIGRALMKSLVKPAIGTLIILGILAIVGVYRSLVDGTPFLKAFDLVATAVVSGWWELLRNPIVLTGITVITGLWLFRGYLPEKISPSEIKIGDVSIKLLVSQLMQDTNDSAQVLSKKESDALDVVIDKMSQAACSYFLKVHDQDLSNTEHLRIIWDELKLHGQETETIRDWAGVGYLYGLVNLKGLVFDILRDGIQQGYLKIVLKPKALELIKKKVENQ